MSKDGYLKRDKFSNLHIDDFDRVLRFIAYFTAIENVVEYAPNYIINIIDKAKVYLSDLNFKASDFLKDLLNTVPLFKREGNYIKWGHKSLQDYFCAKLLWIDAKENQEEILKKIYKDQDNSRFYNMLDIFYELDPKSFEVNIIYWLLKDFKSYSDKAYVNFKGVSEEFIKNRIESNFNHKFAVVINDNTSNEKSPWNKFYAEIKKVDPEINRIYLYGSDEIAYTNYIYVSNSNNLDTVIKILEGKQSSLLSQPIYRYISPNHSEYLESNRIYILSEDMNDPLNQPEVFLMKLQKLLVCSLG
ncbi:hypothetical protein [Rufibacter immobilis]|uniref:hypothetical protein n=1 Tax=Rufibacter immobilis TaxID=1348778 RepID=UPI0035E7F32C